MGGGREWGDEGGREEGRERASVGSVIFTLTSILLSYSFFIAKLTL